MSRSVLILLAVLGVGAILAVVWQPWRGGGQRPQEDSQRDQQVEDPMTDESPKARRAGMRTDVPRISERSGQFSLDLKALEVDLTPGEYDVQALLTYQGTSSRKDERLEGITVMGLSATDQNIRNMDLLLSSQGIPYNLTKGGSAWGAQKSLFVVVEKERYQDALSLISAATQAGVLERVSSPSDRASGSGETEETLKHGGAR